MTTEIIIKRRRLHVGQLKVKNSPARFRTCMFGRRWGKNVLAIDEAITAALGKQVVGWFEPTYKYLLIAWHELTERLRPAARRISDQEKRIELLNGGVIEAWTCDTPDPARSRAYDLVIINEAGLIHGLLAMWQAAIRPTLTDRVGRALFLGTPKGASHDFSVLHRQAGDAKEWARFQGPTLENPFIPKGEVEAARAELPEEVFAQEYEGVPSSDGGNPFGLDHIRACTVDNPATGDAVAFGWDFARSQDYTVGVGLDRDYRVVKLHRWQGIPWGEQKARIRDKNGVIPAWGDSTRSRIDDVIVQDLQRLGVPIIGVPFSYAVRQALMQRLQVCLHQHKLQIPDGPIIRELEAFGYEYTARGVRYAAPEGTHDDCVMALALAVYGRDQFGDIPLPDTAPLYDQDKHPGFDYAGRKTKRPWEEGWKPDEGPDSWLPSEQLDPLNW